MNQLLRMMLVMLLSSKGAFAATDGSILNGPLPENLLSIIATITIISVLPILLIVVTSFTRIVIVLSFLRNAIGLQQTPPNSVIIALSLFLTLFIMLPTFENAYSTAIEPIIKENETISVEKMGKIVAPFTEFMLKNTKKDDIEAFLEVAKIKPEENMPFRVVAASFMTSELKKAFEIGFLIFLPFIIIDLLVASILVSMGMMMLPPVVISLPFKIIFFVLIDGWSVISISLIKGFVN